MDRAAASLALQVAGVVLLVLIAAQLVAVRDSLERVDRWTQATCLAVAETDALRCLPPR